MNGHNFIQFYQDDNNIQNPIQRESGMLNQADNKETLIELNKFMRRNDSKKNFAFLNYQSPIGMREQFDSRPFPSFYKKKQINEEKEVLPNFKVLDIDKKRNDLDLKNVNGLYNPDPLRVKPFFSNTAFQRFEANKQNIEDKSLESIRKAIPLSKSLSSKIINLDEDEGEKAWFKEKLNSEANSFGIQNLNQESISICSSKNEEEKDQAPIAAKRISIANRKYINEYSSSDYEYELK